MEEKQAITLLKLGDLQGLEELVRLHQVKAVRTACLITGDLLLAEDIVQDAFLQAYSSIQQFQDGRPFSPWFIRIVINLSLRAARKQGKFQPIPDESSDSGIDLYDPVPLPEDVLQSKETLQAVKQAIQKLPPDERATFIMRYYLQMPEKEIAEILQGALGTIKWWAFSARHKVRASLEENSSEVRAENNFNSGKGA